MMSYLAVLYRTGLTDIMIYASYCLLKWVLGLISTPAMLNEPDRLFSGAKLLISDRRKSYGDDILETTQCLRSWAEPGLIFGATKSCMIRMKQMLNDLDLQSAESIIVVASFIQSCHVI